MSTVTKGRRVHYAANGECFVADVVKAWTPEMVNLVVTADGSNDNRSLANDGALQVWKTSVKQDESKTHNSWHWPERTD